MTKTLYFFTDVETTGLNFDTTTCQPVRNPMLQIAYQLWNGDLSQKLADGNYIVAYDNIDETLALMNDYVTNMHTSTGLVDRLKDKAQTTDLLIIDTALASLLKPYVDQGYRIMPVGNNVQFDVEVMRRHLPQTTALFHYALLDVSSIRRVFDILGSDFGRLVKANKASNHDAQTDIEECRKELLIYKDIMHENAHIARRNLFLKRIVSRDDIMQTCAGDAHD